METADYNEWGVYPLHLTPNEAAEPLLVLKGFFDVDRLPGHLIELKLWRNLVLSDEYYKGPKDSPAALLFFHQLNVCLIEAMYLLKDKPCNTCLQTTDELAKEKNTWLAFPSDLTEAELTNPMKVIGDFFSAYSLPQYREQLYTWLEYGLSSSAANEFIETSDLVTVYENMQRLYSAAWLIHQRLTDKPYLKGKPLPGSKAIALESYSDTLLPDEQDNSVSLYQLNNVIATGNHELISKVVLMIRYKVDSVQAIIYLGANPVRADRLFILVLVANEEQSKASELSNTIEDNCKQFADITALVHHASTMVNAVNDHNAFFCNALKCPVIYLSGDFFLSECNTATCSDLTAWSQAKWERWRQQGKDFFNGAEWYLTSGAFKPALFSLHQAVECMFIAIIRAVTGYRINGHNLARLLTITRMFTGDLYNVFNLEDEEGNNLFRLLQHAYINVRYKDTFEVDSKSVFKLYLLAKKFIAVTEKVYEQHQLMNSL